MEKGMKKRTANGTKLQLSRLWEVFLDEFDSRNVRWGGLYLKTHFQNFSFFMKDEEFERLEQYCKDNDLKITFTRPGEIYAPRK